MSVEAVIPAGGSGTRMGTGSSKQYLNLAGLPLLARTLRVFQDLKEITGITLVVPGEDIEFVRKAITDPYGFSKVQRIVAGGRERQDSVRNGLLALEHDAAGEDVVVIHDAVRPLISGELVRMSIEACRRHGAVTLGVPVKDTIKYVEADGVIRETMNRERLWLTQTPQTFRKTVILEAYRKAYEEGFQGTDDASLVERNGVPVRMIRGSYDNIKITTPEDLAYAEHVLGSRAADYGTEGDRGKT